MAEDILTSITPTSAFCCRMSHKGLWWVSTRKTTRTTIWSHASKRSKYSPLGRSCFGLNQSMDGKDSSWTLSMRLPVLTLLLTFQMLYAFVTKQLVTLHKELWWVSTRKTTRTTIWSHASKRSKYSPLGRSCFGLNQSMDGKVSSWILSIRLLVLTLLLTFQMLYAFVTKQLVTLGCNLKILFGYQDIPGQLVVYKVMVQSSWVLIFNTSYNALESRMSPSAFATHNQTQFAKDYINQWAMLFTYSLVKEYPSTLTTLPN